MSSSGADGILRNVHAVPCQAKYFPHTHRAAESQQHTQLQHGIGAGVQSLLRFTGRPHGAFLRLILGQGGIAGDVLPYDRLIQRTAQQGVRLFNHRAGNAGICFLVAFQHNGRFVLKRIIEQVQIMRGQVFYRHVAQVWFDVVLNTMEVTG